MRIRPCELYIRTSTAILYSFLMIICATTTACTMGNDAGEEELSWEERRRAERVSVSKALENAVAQHRASIFPPRDLGTGAFTYDLQQALLESNSGMIAFRGYLNDMGDTRDGVLVEFLCALSEEYVPGQTIMAFSLRASQEVAQDLLEVARPDPRFHSLRFMDAPDFVVVARVEDIRRTKRYEFTGVAVSDIDVEVECDIEPRFMGTGELISVTRIDAERLFDRINQ